MEPKHDRSESRQDRRELNNLDGEMERWSNNPKHIPGVLQYWARTIINPFRPSRYIIIVLPEHLSNEELQEYFKTGFPWPAKERDL